MPGEPDGAPLLALPYLPDRAIKSIAELSLLAANLAEALDYLHSNGYVHRDVKRSNVRFDGEHAYLLDFDLAARWRPGDHPLQGSPGTDYWRAPEVRLAKPHDSAVDIWGHGLVVLDELLRLKYDPLRGAGKYFS